VSAPVGELREVRVRLLISSPGGAEAIPVRTPARFARSSTSLSPRRSVGHHVPRRAREGGTFESLKRQRGTLEPRRAKVATVSI